MMKGLKVGAYVDVLPSHKKEAWAIGKKWPSKVTGVRFNNEHGCIFQLENYKGSWSETGLRVVIPISLENK